MRYQPFITGQAVITVLFVVVIGMLVATGATMTLVNAYTAASNRELSAYAYDMAESGIENGMLRLLRDTSYTGETISFGPNRLAVVTVSQFPDLIIQSVGTAGSIVRKIIVRAHMDNLRIVIDSWKEEP